MSIHRACWHKSTFAKGRTAQVQTLAGLAEFEPKTIFDEQAKNGAGRG